MFEAILVILQTFWREEQKKTDINVWYCQYVRFLAAVKNRLTRWKQKEKYKPSLPSYIIEKLKEVRKIRNKYYHLRQRGILNEETRVHLRVMTRKIKIEIGKYKATQWQNFLATIQQTHDNKDKMFWSYLSRIYRSRALPFYKIACDKNVLSEQGDAIQALHRYYAE